MYKAIRTSVDGQNLSTKMVGGVVYRGTLLCSLNSLAVLFYSHHFPSLHSHLLLALARGSISVRMCLCGHVLWFSDMGYFKPLVLLDTHICILCLVLLVSTGAIGKSIHFAFKSNFTFCVSLCKKA